jgi:beta-mannosidase
VSSLTRTALIDGWQLRLAVANPAVRPPVLPEVVPATVPGTVHTDLLAAGLIPDPYLDENELALDWIGHQTWSYRTTFTVGPDDIAAPDQHVDLVCDGLDTIARVLVNGREVGRFFNQHRSYRIPLENDVVAGPNELEVVFESAWDYAQGMQQELGRLPNAYPTPFNFIRKMACNFGWDWGPTVVTAGIWRPIALETWSGARLSRVRPTATVTGAAGHLVVEFDLEGSAGLPLSVAVSVGGHHTTAVVAPGARTATAVVDVPDVDLWWPHDLGSQPLYDVAVELSDADSGEVLDSWHRRIGFRSLRLDTTPDANGSAFTFVINDVPVFIRGANWIPDDCFPSRITPERLRQRLVQATGANINLLRVWGGGIYESEDFYGLCDELGVLVWQDFLFACAAYPEEEPIRGEVLAEAAENVARLMPHPSLVLWNGCNENIWGWFDWDWQESVGDRSWGAGYYLELLPALVAEIDPSRPYYPGSPYSGSMDIHPNADGHGLRHIWDVWNDIDYTAYRNSVPRFVAEFGYQAPPAMTTLRRSIHDKPLSPTSVGMLHHQKATDGNGKLARGAAPHLPVVAGFDDWHYLMQLQQAEAIRYGIEHFRSHRGTCMGTVVWQLNDCWPVTSWAAVDGDGRRKLLWYGLRAAYASRLLTIQPRPEGLSLIGVNDGGASWRGAVTVERRRFDGTVLARFDTALVVDRLAAADLALPAEVTTAGDAVAEFLVATAAGGERALWFFAEDKDLSLTPNVLRPDVRVVEGGIEVTVQGTELVRHLVVLADRWHPDAVAAEALVTLLPGQRLVLGVSGPADADPATFLGSGALVCLNDVERVDSGLR